MQKNLTHLYMLMGIPDFRFGWWLHNAGNSHSTTLTIGGFTIEVGYARSQRLISVFNSALIAF